MSQVILIDGEQMNLSHQVAEQVGELDVTNVVTQPKTNIAPENGWLEDYFPFGEAYFQVLC